ncbi:PREDICTED: protein starmaker-like [Vollenhovia emeryi]|uniref:protein starmaker-like n=1 Tax=Vollenhovia emeryi TaxID=411798 RepID=UPI0005F37341|nr:PREDICTED: protein starmaker-like [Vollenhovia emeryi]
MQNSHEQQRLPYGAVDHREDSESVQVPEYTIESRPTSVDSLTEATDAANSSAPTSSANSSVSNVSMEPIKLANSLNSAKALFRKRSLVQLINSYIKAGIEEGKRQAKKYIRKALSFGVRSGYLIPTDRQGSMLRVCPTLDTQSWRWGPTDAESRQRRRIARRGKTHLTTIADRKAMRRGIPRDQLLHSVGDRRTDTKRRNRTRLAKSPARSSSTRESPPRKSPGKSRERNKRKASTKRNSKISNAINNKREQQQKEDNDKNKKSVKRRRTSFSAKRAKNDHEPVGESYKDVSGRDRDQYKSNEENYRPERRKSTSSQEDESMEKRDTEANINDDRIESRNSNDEDNDKKSDEGSVEQQRRRKPNIPELVYKYLAANEAFDDTEHRLVSKCHSCGQEKHHDEVIDSPSQVVNRGIGYRVRPGQRKDSSRVSKLPKVKRRPISKDLPSSYLQKCIDSEDTRKAKKYMKKALDFGVESGYLIPSDPTYRILRVSSDLMKSDSRRSKSICDTALSKNRNIPTKLEDLQVQEQRRRRGRRGRRSRRSKSGSRTRRRSRRGRRRSRSRSIGRKRNSSPQNPEEVVEDKADDYEMDENDPKSNIHTGDIEREPKTVRSNQPDKERSTEKVEEDGSDLSLDEDETDDEMATKEADITKS